MPHVASRDFIVERKGVIDLGTTRLDDMCIVLVQPLRQAMGDVQGCGGPRGGTRLVQFGV